MENTQKTVTVPTGPLGYVYACRVEDLDLEEISFLAARSTDSDLALLPLMRNLTVEKTFTSSLAVVSGARTTGLAGAGITLKLTTSHFYPSVFVFHGGKHVLPSSAAPNLTRACNAARERFGFSRCQGPPVDGAVETTGAEICTRLGLEPENTILYLVVTALFKEAVFMCNVFLHYGGLDIVHINHGDVIRIPLFPVQLFMPDVNRLVPDPFNTHHRSIGEGFVYPTPFYNTGLCHLIHDCVIAPMAVALRVRNVTAVARGAAHLAFDENHEGAVLPPDITYTYFQSSSSGTTTARGARRNDVNSTSKPSPSGGFERRLASIMAADTALHAEVIFNTGIYEETPTDIKEWPMFIGMEGTLPRLNALGSYTARVAGVIGAMVFSPNSALYLTEVEDSGMTEAKDGGPGPSFNRFYQFAGPHLAANPQTDRDGHVLSSQSTGSSNTEFSVDYLALICGFGAPLLARLLFYLERCDAGAFTGGHGDALKYVTGTFDSEIPCSLCEKHTRPVCAHTTVHRLRQRMPRFGQATRQPIGVFGTMNSQYSDCDPLGNYAPYLILRKPGDQTEAAKATMQDTYRATLERLFIDLEQERLLDRGAPCSSEGLSSVIVDHPTFRRILDTLRARIEQTTTQFMKVLVETRDYKIREGLSEATHSMALTFDPYSGAFCPITNFLVKRTHLAVVQDLALSQCHCVFYGQQVEGRNFRNQFQPVLRRRFVDLFNGGFISTRSITVTLSEGPVSAPNPTLGQDAPAGRTFDGDLARVSVEVIRDIRVKNRVVFSGNCTNLSEAARARLVGLASAYQRQEKRVDMLHGALGFLLKQFHGLLFPRGMPPNSKSPNPQWFWTLLQRNQMPADKLTHEEITTIAAVKRFTEEYAAINFINLPPTCIGELAQFYMANLILKYCDHSQYLINTLTSIITGARRPRDPSSVLHWIRKDVTSAADIETQAKALLEKTENLPELWTTAFTSTHLVRAAMNQRPMVVLGISISKYHGAAGNNRVFQAGNWSGLNGGKNVCPLFTFDRTRRFIIACPRGGFICPVTGPSSGNRETTLSDQVRGIIVSGGAMVQLAIYATVVRAVGARAQHMAFDDWLSLTDNEFLARDLEELHDQIIQTLETPWTVEGALEAVKILDEKTTAGDGETPTNLAFNFDSCEPSHDTTSNVLNISGSNISGSTVPGLKRPPEDDELFDLSGIPIKHGNITMEMI
uniref:ORF29 n=1 Tax=Human herpesvirus 3 TaxID=10335 RepID=A0A0F7CVJ5_HHV3|nr:ORF29 [Human alphaherpesvirus 3]